ncbi:hypothetical protein [Proteiniphilum sp. UBA1028]|uniref:hypothetical protein n=1 Tax=Proteiniphilum sp. UBA1028 TaxID=1947251 RepID=UPI0025FD1FCE|nr:hypothetical protein [Proteiniphilum sp. UBA1028]
MIELICIALLMISCGNQREKKTVELNDGFSLVQFADTPEIIVPPAHLELNPFYKKYMNVNGIHVISSGRVPDSCFYAAYITVKALTDMLPAVVLESLTSRDTRIGIMARYEGTTDIPEHAHLVNDTSLNWDVRARGLGGNLHLPLTTCAEENILGYQIDKYHAEDILIHEFAHTIHSVGISPVDPGFNKRLQASLDNALARGRWVNTYAATNIAEYWAEGVQSWFNINAEVNADGGDGKHNKVNTRKELKKYDPGLFEIISAYFPETDEPISRHTTISLYQCEI